jgi:hypothetical protein
MSTSDPIVTFLQHKLDVGNAEFKHYYSKYTALQAKYADSERSFHSHMTAGQPRIIDVASEDTSSDEAETTGLLAKKAATNAMEMASLHVVAAENAHRHSLTLENEIQQIEESKEFKELRSFIEQTERELSEHNKKLQEEALVPEDAPGPGNWIKRNYQRVKRHFLPTVLTTGDLSGSVGFVTNIYLKVLQLSDQVATTARVFFEVISSPLALGVMAAGTLLDTYMVWRNEKMKQRKTRYLANLATLGLLAVAIPIVMGIIAAPVVAVPLIFLGVNLLGRAKDNYILQQTRLDIQNEESAIREKEEELRSLISTVISHDSVTLALDHQLAYPHYIKSSYYQKPENIQEYGKDKTFQTAARQCELELAEAAKSISNKLMTADPRIQRLSIQINEHKNRLDSLKMTVKHLEQGKRLADAFLFSVGCLITGAVFAMIPPLAPLAAFFTLMGAAAILGAIFVGTYLRYKQQGEIAAAAKAKDSNQHEISEQNTINHVYLKELKHKAYHHEEARLSRKADAFSSKQTMHALGGAEAFATAATTPFTDIGPPDSPVTTLAIGSGIPRDPLSTYLKHPHNENKHDASHTAPQPRAAAGSSNHR